MPSGTPIRTFIKDLRTRKSQIARKLDACSADANCRTTILPDIQAWDPADPLPAALITVLDLTPKEVEHINQWNTSQKNSVRNAAVTAITGSRDMEFFWDLYDDPASGTAVNDPGGMAKITVTFLSPRANVRVSGPTLGQIKVDI